jgi:hypothetical protein
MQISLRVLLRVHAAISVLLLLSLACIAVLNFGEAASEETRDIKVEHDKDESESLAELNLGEPLDQTQPGEIGVAKPNKSSRGSYHYCYYYSTEHDQNQSVPLFVPEFAPAYQTEDASESLPERDREESDSLGGTPSTTEHDMDESEPLAEHDTAGSEPLDQPPPNTTEHEKREPEALPEHDESLFAQIRTHPYTMVALWSVAASSVVAWCLVGALALHVWKIEKANVGKLPKGITLSPDEIVAHADILKSQGLVDLATQDKPSLSKSSQHKEVEAEIFNDKRSVYVFDGDSMEETYVIVEVRGCEKGPPLVPKRIVDGEERWGPPEDRYQHFAHYLVLLMRLLRQEDWSDRILPHMKGESLVRYQAAVREKEWRKLWEALLKPFAEQRVAYRGVHKCRKAPDVYFGVNARFVHKNDIASDESSGREHGRTATVKDPELSDLKDGIPLPSAAEWLDFWSNQDIPQRRTFIEFASSLGNLPLPPRSNSFPDLRGRVISL